MTNNYKTIAWNVDTQRDFMETLDSTGYQGKLALENGMDIANNLQTLTNYLQKSNIPMFGSQDYHTRDSKELSKNPDFINTFPEHCMQNTYGAENIDATKLINPLNINWDKNYNTGDLLQKIKDHTGEVMFQKDKFDVFEGNKYTTDVIKNLGVENVLVYGVATDVCNNAAVTGFRKLGIQVYAITDTMKGINYENSKKAIESWQKGANPAKIITLENVLRGEY